MNNATIIMVVIALGSAAGAWAMRPQPLEEAQFEDTGEPLFAEFTDPNAATSLDVTAYSEDDAQLVRFSVMQKDGRWVIPSHNDYPADGTEQMAKAAASFIDVKKDLYYSDQASDHAAFGVLDPEGSEGDGESKGQRITIKDASGTELVDIIVGKQVEGRQGYYYVRKPDEKRVYGSQIELDISTDFQDWIERDLLKVERDDFVRMTYDPYRVDEQKGEIIDRNPIVAVVADPTLADRKEWKLLDADAPFEDPAVDPTEPVMEPEPEPEGGKTLDSVKVRGILTSMANLKIVGVRPRPPARSMIEAQLSLQPKGFFVTPQGELVANEGMVQGVTDDGVVYSLLFGEVTHLTGIELTAGKKDDAAAEPDEGADEGETEGGDAEDDTKKQASRFMFVNVHYDPSLDTTLAGGATEGADEGDEGGDEASDEEDEEKKLPGPERAEKLNQRFGQWFYVISDSSFKQIHKERDELFKG